MASNTHWNYTFQKRKVLKMSNLIRVDKDFEKALRQLKEQEEREKERRVSNTELTRELSKEIKKLIKTV